MKLSECIEQLQQITIEAIEEGIMKKRDDPVTEILEFRHGFEDAQK